VPILFLTCTGGADGGAARVYGYEGRLICELKTKGEFIFVYVWAMGLTSCFVYRVRPAGRFVRRVRLAVADTCAIVDRNDTNVSGPGHECRSAVGEDVTHTLESSPSRVADGRRARSTMRFVDANRDFTSPPC